MKNTTSWFRPAAAATSALVLGLSLAACSGGDTGASSDRPENEVHVLVYGDAGNTVEQAMVDKFNETSDVKVVLDTIPGAEYQQKLQTVIDTDSAPDVFFNWGGGSITDFVDAGLLMPLNDFMEEDPQLREGFLPTVLEAATVEDEVYGIPMRGTQPVMLFSNEEVLASAGITEPPATWDDLMAAVEQLKAAGVTPIALGGADEWPTQMWFSYVYDRVAGPELFEAALNGDTSVWESEESREALGMLRELVDSGAFGSNYQSVKFTDGGSASLLSSGQAGFELMGSWAYSTHRDAAPEFAANSLGYSEFPEIEGGKGDPANVVGNTNNYYSVLADTRYPDTVRDFLKLMYSDEFVQEQVAIGNLPTTTNTEQFLDEATNPDYARFQYEVVQNAPNFQLSWDQEYTPSATPTIHGAVADFFSGRIDEDGFIAAMQGL
ncbi:extracellular solute-binding protein [Arthrobacter sp. zg-Y820]|uniref:ABC transporter substrate-binding protein n=1 Tax=unclassified Arthrobacter TaxID=235627 RepID=UPI001E2CE30C|nr:MULTISPECIES: extracellular solute-binding protein [unclassified Arthrobacter]MCC9195368.1 extracellular solute-binding protein [Arthrobacter sp. zg-Y820]MDK1278227.1 extracellular solute-binding protein [Arthrobacter sp. zg.Y820]MDK1361296.1 extracellular solute-binding protein [Arthrobacter sp. zg-Y1219]WIB10108.1 extracellular solute-binding protein [Arthrobacter sp. zg-Y820]